MNILVTGGRGYIGSHACKMLAQFGHKVTCLDDESRGRADVSKYADHHKISTHDRDAVVALLKGQNIECVMHFAAFAYVGESVQAPELYYHNNVAGTLSLLQAMLAAKVKRMIFSSSCATYGTIGDMTPIDENHRQEPVNPYGRSKLFCEEIIRDFCNAYGFSSVALRYFNAAGADPQCEFGEDHDPETHLLPLAIRAAIKGSTLTINGNSFPTADGTAIRDFVHVNDIVEAHIRATELLSQSGKFHFFNLGNQQGYSILEVVRTVEAVCAKKITTSFGPPREGDPSYLVSDSTKARKILNWSPAFVSLEKIIRTAVAWETKEKTSGPEAR